MTIKGGAGGLTPNGKSISNFHFNYLHPSLSCPCRPNSKSGLDIHFKSNFQGLSRVQILVGLR